MITIAVPAFVMIAGLLVFALSPRWQKLGAHAFFVGLFFLTWALSGKTLHF